MVHIVTNDTTNYVVTTGKLIFKTYKHINLSPYPTYCLNLMLKYICKLDHIAKLVRHAL